MAGMGENQRKAQSFEELLIFQRGRKLTSDIYKCSRAIPFIKDYGLVNQIRRAAVSIMSNIAEGYERGSRAEFIQFLYIAKGSCGEVRSQLYVAKDQQYITEDEFSVLFQQCRELSSMISGLILKIQKSDYKGEKYERK